MTVLLDQPERPYRVFFTHGSADKFLVTRFLKPAIEKSGAEVFVDTAEIDFVDDYRVKIIHALNQCDELVALLTPTAITRPWVHAEIGACIVRSQVKLAVINYFISPEELQSKGILSLLGAKNLMLLEDLDDYIDELTRRVRGL